MKEVKIGVIGFGTVGSGLYSLLHGNASIIQEKTGLKYTLQTICDLRLDYVKKNSTNVKVTDRWEEIIDDPDIDIVAELIGGTEPAKSIILSALEKGKSVVTANKKLLAEEGADIFTRAESASGTIGFEASVGGGIPCLLALKVGLVGNRTGSVMGILNGTTNYILSRMEDDSMDFNEALTDAQKKGFAEADPTFDIEGIDAGHKIALLSRIAFNRDIDFGQVTIEGISGIKEIDIDYARDMGYTIKLLGIAKVIDDKLDIRVHPTMLPRKHPLASVREEFNAVMYDCDMTGPVMLTGKGAGSCPTASAVLSDIVQISSGQCSIDTPAQPDSVTHYISREDRISRYYLRLHADDRPGILAQIGGILAKYDISLSSVIQKELHVDPVPLVFMTHDAREEGILTAIKEIGNFEFVHGDVMLIRVEDSQH